MCSHSLSTLDYMTCISMLATFLSKLSWGDSLPELVANGVSRAYALRIHGFTIFCDVQRREGGREWSCKMSK